MDYAYSTTMEAVRKSGKHFTLDERGHLPQWKLFVNRESTLPLTKGGKYRHFTAKDSPFAP